MSISNKPNTPPKKLDAGSIMALSTEYWRSQTLLTANRLGIFEIIESGKNTTILISEALDLKQRHTELFLNACAAMGLIERDGSNFTNTQTTKAVLLPGGQHYLGNAIKYSDDLYDTWGKLETSLREGTEQLKSENYLGQDANRTRHFVYGMHDRALGVGNALVDLISLEGKTQMLDVGGGPGTYSVLFTRKNPGLKSTVLELPPISEVASEIVENLNATEQVSFLPGDYHQTEFPSNNDVVLISGVFHRESEENCKKLIKKAIDTLEPGGTLLISDVFTDADGTGSEFATLFGLNMMLTAPDGGVHSSQSVATWMKELGIKSTEILPFPIPNPHTLVVGHL